MDSGFWDQVESFEFQINGKELLVLSDATACSLSGAELSGPAVVVSDPVTRGSAVSISCYPVGLSIGTLTVRFSLSGVGEGVSANLTVNQNVTSRELWSYAVGDDFAVEEADSNLWMGEPSDSANAQSGSRGAPQSGLVQAYPCVAMVNTFHPGLPVLGDCDANLGRISRFQQQALARKESVKRRIEQLLVSQLAVQCQQKLERRRDECVDFLSHAISGAVDNTLFDTYYVKYINHVSMLFLISSAASSLGFFDQGGNLEPFAGSDYWAGAEALLHSICDEDSPPPGDCHGDSGRRKAQEGERGTGSDDAGALVFPFVQRVPVLINEGLLSELGALMTENTQKYLSVVQIVLQQLAKRAGIETSWKVSALALGVSTTVSRATELASLVGVDDLVPPSDFEPVSQDDLLFSRIRVVTAGDGAPAFGGAGETPYREALAGLLAKLQDPLLLSADPPGLQQYNAALAVFIVCFYGALGWLAKRFIDRLNFDGAEKGGRSWL